MLRAAVLAVLAAALGILVYGAARGTAAQEQMGSGHTARTFFEALARGDLDAAMALLVAEPELQTPDGDTLTGAEAVHDYLAALPAPIAVGAVIPWGGHKIEVHVVAGDTPLVFLMDGGEGVIVFIDVSYDSGDPPAASPTATARPARTPSPTPTPAGGDDS